MRIKLLIFLNCFFVYRANAQIVFSENFTATFSPSANGWFQQNNSTPMGSGTWFQGNASVFPALNGQVNDFFACNFSSQAGSPGGISNFLITPTLNLVNGAVFRFYTRTSSTSPSVYPDRLQLLMSQGSGTGSIGSGTAAVGTFTDLLVDLNPNLSPAGYPFVWSAVTGTVAGITGTVVGRFAFRYFVSNGGPNGTNSDYIGIDSVTYTMPCPQSVFYIVPTSTAICSGESALLTAVTTLTNAPTSYSWSNGQTASSIVVSPQNTSTYTLYAQNSYGCVGNQSITLVVNPNPVVTASASTHSVCAGGTVILSAAGAATYAWSGAVTTSSNTFNYPTQLPGNYSFSVTGTSSAGCVGNSSVSVLVHPNPIVSATSTQTYVCPNTNVVLSALGADTYVWSGPWWSIANTFTYNSGSPTSTGSIKQFTVVGTTILTSCTASAAVTLSVYSNCSGLSEAITGAEDFSVFPNPFTDELRVVGAEGGRVEICNTLGQAVIMRESEQEQSIPTHELPRGIYFLKVYDTTGARIKIVTLQKN